MAEIKFERFFQGLQPLLADVVSGKIEKANIMWQKRTQFLQKYHGILWKDTIKTKKNA